jgi:hypothetical protein
MKKDKRKATPGDNKTAFGKQEQQWYMVFFTKLNTPATFWLGFFLLLFFYLQKQLAFHFYFIEQEQIFLWSYPYLSSVVIVPGGMTRLLTEFCIQFFIQPYCGALIMSAIFTLTGIFTAGIIKRMAPNANLFILSLLPIVLLFYIHFDVNYFYWGTMAYMLMLLVLYGYFSVPRATVRLVYATAFGVILFWCAGAVAFLFVICVFLWELLNRISRAYLFILPVLLVMGLAYVSIYTSMVGSYRFLFLPNGYYAYRLHPNMDIYFAWIFLPVLLIVCRFMRNRQYVKGVRKYIEAFLQLLLVVVAFHFGMDKFANRNNDFYEELDYYMRTEQWAKIIERCSGELKNYLYKRCLNVALAEKGELAERMFAFDQQGVQSIFTTWNREPHIAVLMSDIYFSMGQIALSQQMAFEANESVSVTGSPRMLKRLVQTNLIYGAFPIAEKYIDILEQTWFYREWAREHRRVLWNFEAIENDSLLGLKRKCIPETDLLSELQGLNFDLEFIAKQNPAHQVSIQYSGAMYLLVKELFYFKDLVDRCYKTDLLPHLPKSFQEAIVILSEQDPSLLEIYDISDVYVKRYNEYKRIVLANRNNTAALPGLLKRSFGDTYWFYYMFINIKTE